MIAYFGLSLILFAIVFGPLLSSDFVYWDDRSIFLVNKAVLDFNLAEIFTNLQLGGYFPLTQLSLALDHLIAGVSPAFMHAENLLLHAANSFLVFLVARRIFQTSTSQAIMIGFLFAFHPMNVETAAWISGGRKDLLCTFFYLLSLLSFRESLQSEQLRAWLLGFLTVLFGVLSLASKAMGLTLPFSLLLVLWIFKGPYKFRNLAAPLALSPLALLSVYLENVSQKTTEHMAELSFSFSQALMSGGQSLLFCIGRSLFPHRLAVFYETSVFHFDWMDWLAFMAFLTLIALTIVTKASRKTWAPLLFFILTIGPVLKFIPFGVDSVFNNRYFYLPGMGFIAFLAFATHTRPIASVFVVLIFSFLARAQAETWKNQETLWQNVLTLYPGTSRAYTNLSLYYTENEQYPQALEMFQLAIPSRPSDLELQSNLGVLYTRMGQYEQAQLLYQKLLTEAPHNTTFINNLAYSYLYSNQPETAKTWFIRSLQLHPDSVHAISGLIDARMALGQLEEARQILLQARIKLGDNADFSMRSQRIERLRSGTL